MQARAGAPAQGRECTLPCLPRPHCSLSIQAECLSLIPGDLLYFHLCFKVTLGFWGVVEDRDNIWSSKLLLFLHLNQSQEVLEKRFWRGWWEGLIYQILGATHKGGGGIIDEQYILSTSAVSIGVLLFLVRVMLWYENHSDFFKFIWQDNLILTLLVSGSPGGPETSNNSYHGCVDFLLGVACNNMFSAEIHPPKLSCSEVSTVSFTVLLLLTLGEL